jgi:hypothetical protein
MTDIKRIGATIAVLAGLFGFVVGVQHISALQTYPFPVQAPEQLRFQLIGDEPIAGPDGRSVVNGWSALVFKDRKNGGCYLAFKQGPSISVMPSTICPP